MLIIDIVGPVFLLIAVGFLSVRHKLFPVAGIGGLVSFVNNFATPCLLFRAMLNVDFRAAFDPGFLLSFYTGAFVAFAVGIVAARYGFGRRPGESVVVGFAAYFTNTVLVGLPIVHRAYGEMALPLIYAIIGLHSPEANILLLVPATGPPEPHHRARSLTLAAVVCRMAASVPVCRFRRNRRLLVPDPPCAKPAQLQPRMLSCTRLPCWRSAAPCAAPFVTRHFGCGMWRRRRLRTAWNNGPMSFSCRSRRASRKNTVLMYKKRD